MPLVIFDLDDTLIAGDSSSLWFHHLIDNQMADPALLDLERKLITDYRHGRLQMDDYMRLTLGPLIGHSYGEVAGWVARFIEEKITPRVYPAARDKIARYQDQGWHCLVISASSASLVQPIAASLGIPDALGIQPELADGLFTGKTVGTLTYKQGKVDSLHDWLADTAHTLDGSHAYSDSINDVPLLSSVEVPFVVNPDTRLAAHADQCGWQRLDWIAPSIAA